jgi:hypothetical protein
MNPAIQAKGIKMQTKKMGTNKVRLPVPVFSFNRRVKPSSCSSFNYQFALSSSRPKGEEGGMNSTTANKKEGVHMN